MLEVSYSPDSPIVVATINRPHKRNAVDHETLTQIAEAIDATVDQQRRVFVLTGAGGNFCSGADLGGVEGPEFLAALRRVLDCLMHSPIVTIAAVEGFALGGGTQLAAFADLRVATADATFGIPAAKLGIAVDQATVARVLELCGGGVGRSMLLAADTFSGQRAYDMGFVQRIGGLDIATAWAAEIAALAPLTIASHKAALAEVSAGHAGTESPAARAAFDRAWQSADLVEGRTAFAEKRRPTFTGH